MTLLDFIKLLISYKKWLLTLPIIVAASVFVLTMRQPKEYTSQALLYTGVVPTSDETVNVQARVDVFAVNNAIDNIQTILTSRQVLQEVSHRMIARHLIRLRTNPKTVEKSISTFWSERQDVIKLVSGYKGEEEIVKALQEKSDELPIRWLVEDETSFYSTMKTKSGLKVKRSGSSDLLEVQFVSNEASVAKETLSFLIDVFTRRFKDLKKSEVGSMVAFFEKEVAKAAERLSKCAEDMKSFQVKNRIINYYEQTHLTSIETEHLNGQYYDELMKLAAAEQAFQDLRTKLGDPFQQALSSEEIIRAQQRLSELMTKKQLANPSGRQFQLLVDSISRVEGNLRESINRLYVDGRTEEGVSKKEVLKQWLEKFIALSEARARVVVMESRKTKQEKEYDFFAPLGSVLHNFERQMDVAEREYLDLLHSLNQARLRQQSTESSTSLATVDPPTSPLKAEPSKRKLLVVIGWLGTLLIIIGVIIFIEYFDSTLQSPERAESKTGLTVLGALTKDMESKSGKLAQANLLLRYVANIGNDGTQKKVLFIHKNESTEGEWGLHFAELLHRHKQQVALAGTAPASHNGFPLIAVEDLNKENQFDAVIASLPSLANASSELKLVKSVDEVVVVVACEHMWNAADSQTVSLLEKITKKKPYLLLTGIEDRRLENWIGELPKERSKFRKLVKKLIKFQFN
ncbi:MAG TPA: Wzz/FepE/Etk N-terminal domain-containing protein [Cyclobacteriaceae bacterium]|jgi:uncharacterized protein involved in exopolysaccharide biosynthesis|nr:Wzz/FepE/Etk N-terminal domain-containing protein [Cyclobacteriaceae bacterium]